MKQKKTSSTTYKKRIEDLEHQLKEVTENWKRAVADYQNLEKRTQRDREEFAQFASKQLIEKLLPVLDTLEIAAQHVKDNGLNLAIETFKKALQEEGLERIDTNNRKFDPFEMECIETISGKKDDFVCEQIQAGYKLKGKVIRPAQVKVGKEKENSKS